MTGKPIASAFWQILFRRFHELHRGKEPESFRDYANIRVALHDLLTFTGMTIEQLAAKIEINTSSLRMIVARGGLLHGEQCEKCRRIALDFDYKILAEFFKVEGMNNLRRQQHRKSKTVDDTGLSKAWL